MEEVMTMFGDLLNDLNNLESHTESIDKIKEYITRKGTEVDAEGSEWESKYNSLKEEYIKRFTEGAKMPDEKNLENVKDEEEKIITYDDLIE